MPTSTATSVAPCEPITGEYCAPPAAARACGLSRWRVVMAAARGEVRSLPLANDRVIVHLGDVAALAARLGAQD